MCGICGFYQTEQLADLERLKQMNDQIIHRGPDDDGYHMDGPVGLAARRLSIIDLNTGHQPLPSDSGNSWITYNGEVYNYRELRRELEDRGCHFRTETDTEVLVNLYQEYGLDFFSRLIGMFAVGIYDKAKDRLIIGRDPVGIKPLYYWFDRSRKNLVFASEIKSILKYPGFKKELDQDALDYFLTLEYIPAPLSIFSGIRKLPGGHFLVLEKGDIRIRRYWDLAEKTAALNNRALTFAERREQFLELLEDAVKRRMISDVPLGAFLSGGIDSSAIVSMMARNSRQRVKTFSIGFEEKSYSELKYSRQVAELFNTDHYTRNLNPDISDLVLKIAGIMDEPLGDFSNFPTYLVSKTAREKVTVVLSGDGGDEIFGGYEHYIAQRMAGMLDVPLLRPFHRPMAGLTDLFPPSKKKKGMVNRIKRFSEGLEIPWDQRHFRWMIFMSPKQKRALYSDIQANDGYLDPLSARVPFAGHFAASKQYPGINQDLYLDFKTYLVDNILVKVDRMSMANSLEARVPLLDHRMVEFAFSLPPEYKIRGKTTKWFFKKCMEGILPESIIYRRKEGFSIPIKNWLKNELKDLMLEYLSPRRIQDAGLFNGSAVEKMIHEHLNNRQNHSHRLWALIQFNLWQEKFLKD